MAIAWLIFLLAIGACVGSFLNVVVWRLPRGQSIVYPPSHCPQCGKAIRWYDNIPVLSWLLLRARCRFCKKPISVRYPIVEAVTALLVGGLYVWYFLAELRGGAGVFVEAWPMYLAQAALLCGLLACSLVDIEMWIVPLEVCWVVSVVGIVSSAAAPHPFTASCTPASGAMALAAGVGLVVSIVLTRLGLLRPSFIDADDRAGDTPAKPAPEEQPVARKPKRKGKPKGRKPGKSSKPKPVEPKPQPQRITSAAFSKAHGVNPRAEVLREVLFLAPAIGLAIAAYMLVAPGGALFGPWHDLTSVAASGRFAAHVNGLLAAVFGYMIGGLWIWGIRILGTLGFGKEAMGMGDVHILAAVGAVTGWAVPTVAFFVSPFFALAWAVALWLRRGQRELPYGPWLATGSLVVILFYDAISNWLGPHAAVFAAAWNR